MTYKIIFLLLTGGGYVRHIGHVERIKRITFKILYPTNLFMPISRLY